MSMSVCVCMKFAVSQQNVGGFWAGCSICLFVSIQGHFPKREAGLLTLPLSDATSADQGPPPWISVAETLLWAVGKGRERGRVRV